MRVRVRRPSVHVREEVGATVCVCVCVRWDGGIPRSATREAMQSLTETSSRISLSVPGYVKDTLLSEAMGFSRLLTPSRFPGSGNLIRASISPVICVRSRQDER